MTASQATNGHRYDLVAVLSVSTFCAFTPGASEWLDPVLVFPYEKRKRKPGGILPQSPDLLGKTFAVCETDYQKGMASPMEIIQS